MRGLETLLFNIKALCTHRILMGTHGWYDSTEESKKISDHSLIITPDGLKFIDTPEGEHNVALEITQNIK